MVTLEQAKNYVNPVGINPAHATDQDNLYIAQCLLEAQELVDAFTDGQTIPVNAKDRAVLETVSELYHRRNAPNGLAQFSHFDGTANVVRVARDPMIGAYPILSRFMVIGL